VGNRPASASDPSGLVAQYPGAPPDFDYAAYALAMYAGYTNSGGFGYVPPPPVTNWGGVIYDGIDAFFAGYANSITFGYSNYLREQIYSPAANNHSGYLYNVGSGAGIATGIALGYQAGAYAGAQNAGSLRAAVYTANAYTVAGDAYSSFTATRNIASGGGSFQDFLGLAPVIGYGTGYAYNRVFQDTTAGQLAQALQRARDRIGPGSGRFYGTRVHTEFKREVDAIGSSNLATEVTYYNGQLKRYGYPGSIRADVVEGPLENPTAIYDLKTGGARLTQQRMNQMRRQLPGGGGGIPIIEIR
jgi:hypothetical protein